MVLCAPHYSGSLDISEYPPADLIVPRVPLVSVVLCVGRRLLPFLTLLDFPPRIIESAHICLLKVSPLSKAFQCLFAIRDEGYEKTNHCV